MLAEQAQLAAARKALRDNCTAIREQIVELVSLASQHFPELKSDEDIKRFMGSDGLQVFGRRLADYDDQQT
eukprot:COSAG06_NODE_28455_length_574_cov_0.532632_1_plen_70_part_01